MSKDVTIVITGGSTAGHITPNTPLIKEFLKLDWDIHCVVLGNDLERKLLKYPGVKFHKISTGKLRRYFDFRNFSDIFKIIKATAYCRVLIRKIKPNIIFSKGGHIAFPVIISGWLNNVPIILHESDSTPSLTTKLCAPFVSVICKGFKEIERWKFPFLYKKTVYTGIPLRDEILQVQRSKHLHPRKFKIFIVGGSLGAETINKIVRKNIVELTKHLEIYHVCGENKTDTIYKNITGYHQYEFIHEEITTLLSEMNLVICRGGATTLYEMLYLQIPMLIIPLSKRASRGEQIANAIYLKNKGVAEVLLEKDLSNKTFLNKLFYIQKHIDKYKYNMQKNRLPDSTTRIMSMIKSNLR